MFLYQILTQNMLRTHKGNKVLPKKKKIWFGTSLDLIKCLKQILTYATICYHLFTMAISD